MHRLLPLLIASCCVVLTSAQPRVAKPLDIYIVDVEGGNATLFVAPSGESLLIDAGNGGPAAVRDAGRIMAAVNEAGLKQIDHFILTHYHGDHFGGLPELASRIPIRDFIDHGANVQPTPATDMFVQAYAQLHAKARHTIAKPGDRIAVGELDTRVVTAGGQVIQTPLPGAGRANPYCAAYKPMEPDTTENAQSVGVHATFGRFRVLHLGDITWNKEFDLMCPNNRLGTVDLFVVSHHGQAISNGPVLVHAIASRVAIMNNGTRKGGQPDAMRVLHSAPGLEDLWQLHFSQLSGQEYTVPGLFIANTTDEAPPSMPIAAVAAPPPGPNAPPAPIHNGAAYWVKVSAQQDGSFSVRNARNAFTKTYRARR